MGVAPRAWRFPRMRSRRHRAAGFIVRLAGAGLVALGSAGAAHAQTQQLDLESAVQLAVERTERAKQADERHTAADARLDRARSFFFPDLGASGSYIRRAYETVRTVEGEQFTISSRNALLGSVAVSLAIFDPRSI